MSLDDVWYRAAFIADAGADSPATGAVTVALIGAAALALTAVINGYFGTRGDRGAGRAELRRQLDEAEWDAAHAENDRRDAEREARRWRARYEALCSALWRRGFDPNKFITGEEPDTDARF